MHQSPLLDDRVQIFLRPVRDRDILERVGGEYEQVCECAGSDHAQFTGLVKHLGWESPSWARRQGIEEDGPGLTVACLWIAAGDKILERTINCSVTQHQWGRFEQVLASGNVMEMRMVVERDSPVWSAWIEISRSDP